VTIEDRRNPRVGGDDNRRPPRGKPPGLQRRVAGEGPEPDQEGEPTKTGEDTEGDKGPPRKKETEGKERRMAGDGEAKGDKQNQVPTSAGRAGGKEGK